MCKAVNGRPQPNEYAENHLDYINEVPGDDILNFLQEQLGSTVALLNTIDETRSTHRYEAGKWSIREVFGHIIDAERVFAYRALTFGRGDQTPLPGFDQEPWARHANYENVKIRDIAAEFESVRRSTIFFFKHLAPEAWDRRGTAHGKEVTTRAIAFMIGGHGQHHLTILKARYLA
jgi:hypothetical protein